MISRYVTVAFSAEMAGPDGQRLLDVAKLQEANGSVGHSPSATAYFALYVRPGDPAALNYLRSLPTLNGGIPDVAPFDIFERAWTLWNLGLVGHLDEQVANLCQPHLDFLEAAWKPGLGAGFAAGYTPKDADETGVTFEVLNQFGRTADVEAILTFEEEDYFRCYPLEANPSVSANIHVLSALRRAGLEASHPAVQKIVRFLQSTQFWFDKWHVSPYYPTSHAIIAGTGYVDVLLEDAVSWILTTQNADGSWGYFMPTAEETAYCLQALMVQRQHGRHVPDEVLERGAAWLVEHMDAPYPPLWIGKCLYCPVLVVRSSILSALMLVSQDVRV
jgi:halimadienyl-diphosphate synthase